MNAPSASAGPAPSRLKLVEWKGVTRNTLVGFATIEARLDDAPRLRQRLVAPPCRYARPSARTQWRSIPF